MLPVVISLKSFTSTPVTSSLNVTVKRTLAALVGFGSARVMATTLGLVASYVRLNGAAARLPLPAASVAAPAAMVTIT